MQPGLNGPYTVPNLSTEGSILIDSASHWLSRRPSRWPPPPASGTPYLGTRTVRTAGRLSNQNRAWCTVGWAPELRFSTFFNTKYLACMQAA
jgi:hypothetical protein